MEPRKLTSDEINQILNRFVVEYPPDPFNDLPYRRLTPDQKQEREKFVRHYAIVHGADRSSQDQALLDIRRAYREILSDLVIVPTEIPLLAQRGIDRWNQSQIQPGEAVGVSTAAALGAQFQQTSLNSFHSAGSEANVSSSGDLLQEILGISSNRKNPISRIHFLDKNLTFDQVLAKQSEFIDVSIKNLLIDDPDIDSVSYHPRYWWHDVYSTMWRIKLPDKGFQLRLKFNVDLIYRYRISLATIAQQIGAEEGVICVPSPEAFESRPGELSSMIDIFLNLDDFPDLALQETFLSSTVAPTIIKMQVSGIPGITGFFPVITPILSLVRGEVKTFTPAQIEVILNSGYSEYAELMKRAWYLPLNLVNIRLNGLQPDSLRRLLTEVGIAYQPNSSDSTDPINILSAIARQPLGARHERYIFVVVPTNESPLTYVRRLIKQDQDDENIYEQREKERGNRLFRRPSTPLLDASRYVSAETSGSNYLAIIDRLDVDPIHTWTNNFQEIREVLGIESVRNFLILELSNVVATSGSYLNPRHIELLIDFMTNLGEAYPITFAGTSRQRAGPLTAASIQEQLTSFSDAAALGSKEKFNSITPSIYVGQAAPVGTGFNSIQYDQKLVASHQAEIQKLAEALVVEPINLDDLLQAQLDLDAIDPFSDLNLDYSVAGDGLDFLLGEAPITIGLPAPTQLQLAPPVAKPQQTMAVAPVVGVVAPVPVPAPKISLKSLRR